MLRVHTSHLCHIPMIRLCEPLTLFLSFFGCLFFVFLYTCAFIQETPTPHRHTAYVYGIGRRRVGCVSMLCPRHSSPDQRSRNGTAGNKRFLRARSSSNDPPSNGPPLEQSPPPNHPPLHQSPPLIPLQPPPLPKSPSNHTCRHHRFFLCFAGTTASQRASSKVPATRSDMSQPRRRTKPHRRLTAPNLSARAPPAFPARFQIVHTLLPDPPDRPLTSPPLTP